MPGVREVSRLGDRGRQSVGSFRPRAERSIAGCQVQGPRVQGCDFAKLYNFGVLGVVMELVSAPHFTSRS